MSSEPSDSGISVEHDIEADTYRTTFDSSSIPPSIAVVETVAAVRGTEPTELEPLTEVVDPEALDDLVTNESGKECVVTFGYLDYDVVVKSDGMLTIQSIQVDERE